MFFFIRFVLAALSRALYALRRLSGVGDFLYCFNTVESASFLLRFVLRRRMFCRRAFFADLIMGMLRRN